MTVQELLTIFRNHTHTGAFPDAKRLPAGSVAIPSYVPAIVLRSPGGNKFILSADDDGSLTTEPISFSAILVSPDGSRFILGVDSDGVPTTSPSRVRWSSLVFYDSYPLFDSLGNQFNITVDDFGAILSTPA